MPLSRRSFIVIAAQTCLACGTSPTMTSRSDPARLTARPHPPAQTLPPGEHQLGLEQQRDGLLFVPGSYRPEKPAPLAVMLHGAGGTGRAMAFTFAQAERSGVIVLAPDSRDRRTWDVIVGAWGTDVSFLDRALGHTFDRIVVDPARIAIGGFSDGASYALSVGLANGDLFTDILAYSPGFIAPAPRQGRPAVFISHGTNDEVLPIGATSRRIAPALESAGYDVIYREFEGGHTVPPAMLEESFETFAR